MIWVYNECKKRGIDKGIKQQKHFISVWIRLYFYAIEVLYDRDIDSANLLSVWCHNYYDSVYKYIENNIDDFMFMDCWNVMVSSSPATFIERIINISYPEFYDIISSGEPFITD
jgi:hypothetical protein